MSAPAFLAAWADATAIARAELDALDAAAGDGDHGSTVARGARAAAEILVGERDDGDVLLAAARAFTDAAGGASGPLIGVILRSLGRACGDGPLDDAALSSGLASAAENVARLGRAEPGDGTLLDALVAAASDPVDAAANAHAAAEATAAMAKRKGRAALVAGAGVGHVDPGARSIALLVEVLTGVVARSRT